MRFPDYSPGLESTLERFFPVGHVLIRTDDVNPAVLYGFGVWEEFAQGKVLVGYQEGDPDFGVLLGTTGVKTVTLTTNQIPAHTHVQDPHTHVQNAHQHTAMTASNTANTSGASITRGSGTQATVVTTNATAVNQNATAVNQNTGGGQAHTNLQPSITVRFWRRTA